MESQSANHLGVESNASALACRKLQLKRGTDHPAGPRGLIENVGLMERRVARKSCGLEALWNVVERRLSSTGGCAMSGKRMTKAQVIAEISEFSELDKKSVSRVFDGLTELIKKQLGSRGPGE